jgi:hypothetical protein
MGKLSRRTFAGSLCASGASATFAGAIGSFMGSSGAIGQEFAADSQTVEHWMDQWMKRDRIAVGSLHLSRFSDPIYFSYEAYHLEAQSWSGEFSGGDGSNWLCDGLREHSSNFLVNSAA